MVASDEEASVQRTMDRMIEGYATGNTTTIMSCYEPGAAYAVSQEAPVSGAESLREVFTQILARNPVFTFDEHEIVISQDIALHLSAYDWRGPDGTSGRGLSAAVLRRQSNGEWLMVIDHPAGQRLL